MLASGKVLIAGGGANTGPTASAELYDPTTGTWTGAGSTVTARMSHIAIGLPDGRLLLAAGRTSGQSSLSEAKLFLGPGPQPGITYKLIASHSSKAMDLAISSVENGAAIIQYSDTGGANQQWRLLESGTGTYKLLSIKSGKALDVKDASMADGAPVIQWSDTGGTNQQWRLLDVGNGLYKIYSVKSGKPLAVSAGATSDLATVVQMPLISNGV